MEAGVATDKIPACDWSWLEQISLTTTEQAHLARLSMHLGGGEASCLVVAQQRGYKFASDDKDARHWARELSIPHTGTIGILAILVKKQEITLTEGNHFLSQMIKAGYHAPLTNLNEILK